MIYFSKYRPTLMAFHLFNLKSNLSGKRLTITSGKVHETHILLFLMTCLCCHKSIIVPYSDFLFIERLFLILAGSYFSQVILNDLFLFVSTRQVYLHGVKEPQGKWWEKLKEDSRFVYVHREYPEALYDKAIMTHQVAVGIMRVSILLKYGGVYCDNNVLWTNRIPDEYFGYSAVASPDWHLHGNWPDSVNHGVLMAKKNAKYLLKLRGVLQKYRQNQYWFNDHFMAYKIIETAPEIIFLDRHLQVKCLNHNCHPTWHPNYKSGLTQNKPGGPFSWQNDTLSVHWTDTFPELDLDMVKYTSGMIVEVSRHILQTSGIIIQDLR